MSHKKNINTILAQAGIKSDPATGALITPLHFSTTYQHPEFGQSTGYDYIRTKNPTRVNAEKTLAAIESAEHALVTSSGMSAIVLAFSIFPVGSKVLAVRDLYGGSFRWFNQMEQEGRFFFTYANSEEELVEGLKGEVDILYIETPTNPLMLEFDIQKLAKLAHEKGAKVIVDNTFYLSLIHIFFVRENTEMGQAIQASTGNYSHVAIFLDGQIYHATVEGGVLSQSPEDFFEAGKVYDLYRYTAIDHEEVKKRAESLLGAPYNASFYPDGKGFYCSQFIAELLPVFETIPMKFGDEEEEISPFWLDYYKELGLAVPLDQPGTNPSQLAQSPQLQFKERYLDDSDS